MSGKLVKASDFRVFKQAERALADAIDESDRIRQAAQQAYRDEMTRGYAQGREEALREQSSTMVEVVTRAADYFRRIEGDMVELVLDAVRKVVGDFDDRQRLIAVVRSCLDLVRSQRQLSLRVHPDQVSYLRAQVEQLKQMYPSIAELEVHSDARLAVDACLVESGIGVVEASVTSQIGVLRQVLAGVLAPALHEAPSGVPVATAATGTGQAADASVPGAI